MSLGCFVSLFLFITSVFADVLDPSKVHLIDWTKGQSFTNYIFRGNQPDGNNTQGETIFDYVNLQKALVIAAANQSIVLPETFYIIDYKLYYLEDPDEEPDIELEQNFFKSNPNLGEVRLTRIIGDLTPPSVYPTSYVKSEAMKLSSWQPDDLSTLIPAINALLATPGPQNLPVVVYFHCECGCDRTGEIAGSYVMTYLGYTYTQAYNWDQSIAGRWILPNHNWAMEWYCTYLQYAKGMNVAPCW